MVYALDQSVSSRPMHYVHLFFLYRHKLTVCEAHSEVYKNIVELLHNEPERPSRLVDTIVE